MEKSSFFLSLSRALSLCVSIIYPIKSDSISMNP